MSDYRLIPLHGKHGEGKFAKVSPEDYEIVNQLYWVLLVAGKNGQGYAWSGRKEYRGYLHHFILPMKVGFEVDHRNGDKLDDTRGNLRYATSSQNRVNTLHPGGSSDFRGVRLNGVGNWAAEISVAARKRVRLGVYKTELEAARAYDAAARFYYGEFAKCNFEDVSDAAGYLQLQRQSRMSKPFSSPYKGVSYDPRHKTYAVSFQHRGQKVYVASGFTSAEDAGRAHDAARLYLFGPDVPLNFPDTSPQSPVEIRRILKEAKMMKRQLERQAPERLFEAEGKAWG